MLLVLLHAVHEILDGRPIKPMTICMIGAGGFIGSHLYEKILHETPHKILALDVYNNKIKHLLEPESQTWADRIQFRRQHQARFSPRRPHQDGRSDDKSGGDLHSSGLQHTSVGHDLQQLY